MILPARASRLSLFYGVLAFAFISAFFYFRAPISARIAGSSGGNYPRGSANETLGFGKLFVVSGHGSPRRAYLEQAAAVTGLNLTIPEQPAWTDDDVTRFRWHNESESRVGTGSVKAWLSHHVVLHEFLDSGVETALIFEDDVDWDIRLRTKQIPRAQKAARLLSPAINLLPEHPWGLASDWDLLYLGHCGDYWGDIEEGVGVGFTHPHELDAIAHTTYEDDTMLRPTDLHPFTASLLAALDIPPQTRVMHRSKWPLCSFGYAITRYAAQRIVEEIAPAKEDISRDLRAYDVAIMAACRDSYQLQCYTLTPELFHHMEGESIIAVVEESERKIFRPPVDAKGLEQTKWRHETSNIGCGFWSGDFYYDDHPERLPYLQEEVGRKGQCLKEKSS